MHGIIRSIAPTRRFGALLAVLAVATVAYAAWLAAAWGTPTSARTATNLPLLLVSLTAGGACLTRTTTRQMPVRIRWTWGMIGGGMLCWATGQGIWTWYTTRPGGPTVPSAADIGFVGMAPLTAIGLMLLPFGTQNLTNRIRSALDGLMIASSIAMVSWILILRPVVHATTGTAALLSLWYPMGDVVLVTIVLFMLGRMRRVMRLSVPLVLVGVGLLVFAVADSGWAYRSIAGDGSADAAIDLGWFIGFGLILLAARRPTGPVPSTRHGLVDAGLLEMLLPYASVLTALSASIVQVIITGRVDAFISWNRSSLILLIVLRQLLTLLENRSLTRGLEARVADRTAELRASEQRFQALVQHSSDVVTLVDTDATVLYQSESIGRVFGYPADALTGRPWTVLLDAESAIRLRGTLRGLAENLYDSSVLDVTLHHHDGHACHAEITITNLLGNPSVRGLVLNTRDVSERKELEDQLIHEAFHDALTKLANRSLFKDRVDGAMRRGPTAAVLFLDLDGFKEVNDSIGHAAGDQLLIRVAERLRAAVGPDDTVARFGGDEFAVLLENLDDDRDAERLANRIIESLAEPLTLESNEIHVRASIGIATSARTGDPGDARDADQLMRNADLAMYRAKATGDGSFARYNPQMHSGLVERLQLEADLRRALETDELELFYQPTIDLASGAIVGFEALLRWRHPSRGLVPPIEFIPIAEATGMIRPLGQLVLLQACRQAASWLADDPTRPLTIAVNVSGHQLDASEDLPAFVAMVLADSGLPGEHLCLEMTESVLMTDTEENLAILVRLKELGIRLAIDDFGTGYSSLAYLRRFPVDTLKIDRSFVERISSPSQDSVLARTIVQLGQSLGMSTVAEGIEEASQYLALRSMGCDLGQGYFFARPLPLHEATALLAETVETHRSPVLDALQVA
jgi:diguanylate cyclase (GGDEF)-like protein/PAS domain S-box-containing protein